MKRKVTEQPKPIAIEIPIMNDAIMYSMMDEFTLRRLRQFIDDLIVWKEAGNACYIGTLHYSVITERTADVPQGEGEE